jgi:hypothetical protein
LNAIVLVCFDSGVLSFSVEYSSFNFETISVVELVGQILAKKNEAQIKPEREREREEKRRGECGPGCDAHLTTNACS